MTASPEPYPEPERIGSRFSPEVLAQLFDNPGVSHNELWGSIQPDEAAFARNVIVRAQELRNQGADPGDSYLEAAAVTLAAQREQRRLDASLRARSAAYVQEGAVILRLIRGETGDDALEN